MKSTIVGSQREAREKVRGRGGSVRKKVREAEREMDRASERESGGF